MIVVDVRGYLKEYDKDLGTFTATSPITNFDASKNEVTISSNTTTSAVAGCFDNIRSSKNIDSTHALLIGNNGKEVTVTVVGGTLTA